MTAPEGRQDPAKALAPWLTHLDECAWWEDSGQPSGMDILGGLSYAKPDCTCGLADEIARLAPDACGVGLSESERLARAFHEAYTKLAPDFGWDARESVPWDEVAENNRVLMIATAAEVLSSSTPVLSESERQRVEALREWAASKDDASPVIPLIAIIDRLLSSSSSGETEAAEPLTFFPLAKKRLSLHVETGRELAALRRVRELTPDEEADQILATLSAAGLAPWPAVLCRKPSDSGETEALREGEVLLAGQRQRLRPIGRFSFEGRDRGWEPVPEWKTVGSHVLYYLVPVPGSVPTEAPEES